MDGPVSFFFRAPSSLLSNPPCIFFTHLHPYIHARVRFYRMGGSGAESLSDRYHRVYVAPYSKYRLTISILTYSLGFFVFQISALATVSLHHRTEKEGS